MNFKENILNQNAVFFTQKIDKINQIKIDHYSVLGYAILHGNLETIKNIYFNNKNTIRISQLEEDGFSILMLIVYANRNSNEKWEIIQMIAENENKKVFFNVENLHTNFVGLCLAKQEAGLLLQIFDQYGDYFYDDLDDYQDIILDELLSVQEQKYLDLYHKRFKQD